MPDPRPGHPDGRDDPTRELGSGGGGPARPRLFEDGAVVAQRYRVLRFVAAGGMGDVYEAQDQELGTRVALKTLRLDLLGDEGAKERFKTEILLARKVTHPHVCRIFDLGTHRPDGDGRPVTFLTMEYLQGETLADRMVRAGRLAPEEALPLVGQISEALAAAHRAGVIHRDLKPANVMLVPSGEASRAVVMDFGLARGGERDSGLSRPDHVLGTPAYIAPEQIEGHAVSAATDVYALGVVMYEMLTGTLPFAGGSAVTVALKRLSEEPSSPACTFPTSRPSGSERSSSALSVRRKTASKTPARSLRRCAGSAGSAAPRRSGSGGPLRVWPWPCSPWPPLRS